MGLQAPSFIPTYLDALYPFQRIYGASSRAASPVMLPGYDGQETSGLEGRIRAGESNHCELAKPNHDNP